MDGARPRTATDLELKYNFGRTFAEVYGLATDAQKAAEEAKMAIEGLDHEEIFNRLTNYGEWQGIYRDPNGDVYLNASYIKTGELNAKLIKITDSEFVTGDDLGASGKTIIDAGRIQTGTIDANLIKITNSDFLTGDDLGAEGTTIIDAGRIQTGTIDANMVTVKGILNASVINLLGLFGVCSPNWEDYVFDEELQQYVPGIGGYIGYDGGFLGSKGIGIRSNEGQTQVVCTDAAVRISYGDLYGISQVVCNPDSALVEGYQLVTIKVNAVDRLFIDRYGGFYPANANMTCGTASSPWKDIYAAGTSFSALVARVEALEK